MQGPNTVKLANILPGTATSVAVERIFSQGRLLLPYVCNCLSVQSTQALLCLGGWSLRGMVKDKDVQVLVARLPDVNEESELEEGWDKIC